ncbi:unnamed protein product [Orchesella dallaii]|uniref:Uncharacterized protein n=1 Tax=Orchesella dallaii TaxID=48710 RepID=A0ABP1PQA6_9HEXA
MTTKIVSDFTKSLITLRWKLYHYLGHATFVEWDSRIKEFTTLSTSLTYMYYNSVLLTYGGIVMQFILVTYLIIKSTGDEDGVLDPVVFGTTIVCGWVEWGALCCLVFAGYIVKQNRIEMNYLCNQIFRYCQRIEDTMCHHNLHFGLQQLNYIKEMEVFILLLGIASTFAPPSYVMFLLIEYEPFHEFFQDVFEVDVSFKIQHGHILLFATWGLLTKPPQKNHKYYQKP